MRLIEQHIALHECEDIPHRPEQMGNLAIRASILGPGLGAHFAGEASGFFGLIEVVDRDKPEQWFHIYQAESKEELLRIMKRADELLKFTIEHSEDDHEEPCWCHDAAQSIFHPEGVL